MSKKKKRQKHPGGRPKKIVPSHEVVRLASEGATAEYICESLDISKPLLYRRFRRELDRGRNLRDGCLQMRQFAVALAGSPALLKWLGQQWLGQSDKQEIISKSDPLAELLEQMRAESKRIGPPVNEDNTPMLVESSEEAESGATG
ncbi:MAG: hypothetical protein ACRD4S_12390 [Candidatus Acidiferrales bacterium]